MTLRMPAAVLAESVLTGHSGHDFHVRCLLEMLNVTDVDPPTGHAAGALRRAAIAGRKDPIPSGVDHGHRSSGCASGQGRRGHHHQRRWRLRAAGLLGHSRRPAYRARRLIADTTKAVDFKECAWAKAPHREATARHSPRFQPSRLTRRPETRQISTKSAKRRRAGGTDTGPPKPGSAGPRAARHGSSRPLRGGWGGVRLLPLPIVEA